MNRAVYGVPNIHSSTVSGKVMASPDQQIPVSAGFQATQEKASKSGKDRGESIQNHKDEDAHVKKPVKSFNCSQGVQDTSQSQAHVPDTAGP